MVIISSRASLTMVGALWVELTVCPCCVTTAMTIPSIGATTRVYPSRSFLVDFNLRLHRARIERKQFGAGGGERGLGGFEVFTRAGFVVQHAPLAFETRLGLLKLCLLGLQFGFDDVQRRLGVAQIVALLQIVDVGDRLSFGDAIPSLTFSDLTSPETRAPTLTRSTASSRPVANTAFSISPVRAGAVT